MPHLTKCFHAQVKLHSVNALEGFAFFLPSSPSQKKRGPKWKKHPQQRVETAQKTGKEKRGVTAIGLSAALPPNRGGWFVSDGMIMSPRTPSKGIVYQRGHQRPTGSRGGNFCLLISEGIKNVPPTKIRAQVFFIVFFYPQFVGY